MTLARDRAIMFAVGSLKEADLARLGVLHLIGANASEIEIEDVDFVEDSVTLTQDGFVCLATAFFLGQYPEGSMSDDLTLVVSGTFAAGVPVITGISPRCAAQALAA